MGKEKALGAFQGIIEMRLLSCPVREARIYEGL
jgi:hypothetical protein